MVIDKLAMRPPPDFADFDPLAHPLTALVYDENFAIGSVLRAIAESARGSGLRLGGAVEKAGPPPAPDRKCDMLLEDLVSGEIFNVSENRGAFARGCRLDLDALTRVCALVLSRLRDCDLVLLNKFGKIEVEGGGFRCLISEALDLGVPVVIGVPRRNLAAWREFAGELAFERDFGGV
jgi:nucleoside-triphosphatase THEP1